MAGACCDCWLTPRPMLPFPPMPVSQSSSCLNFQEPMLTCGSALLGGSHKISGRSHLAPNAQFLRPRPRHAACPWQRAAQRPRKVAVVAPASSTAPGSTPGPGCPVHQFIAAFNARDLDAMVALLADDCTYHNLAQPKAYHGKQEVRRALQTLLAATPLDWRLIIEDSTAPSSGHRQPAVGTSWRMVAAGGKALPLLSGLSFFKLNPQGRIYYLKESAEQVVKVPESLMPLLGTAAPLLQMLGAPASLATPVGAPAPGGAFGAGASSPMAGPGAGSTAATGSSTAPRTVASAATSKIGSASGPLGQPSSQPSGSSSSSSPPGPLASALPAPPTPASHAPSAAASQSSAAGDLGQLEGVFMKDLSASDMASYERALKLMQIGGLQRTTAIQLLEGLEIERKGDDIALRFLTVVPFFKITELFSLAGTTTMQRRDLKSGRQTATARVGDDGGSLIVDLTWPEPNAGTLQEVYKITPEGLLEVTATIRVAAGSEVTRQIYRRAATWTPRYKWPGF